MKHCDTCNQDFKTKEKVCPVCCSELQEIDVTEELDTGETVSTMTLTGIL